MRSGPWCSPLLLLVACGGGGGATATVPAVQPARLQAADLEFAAGQPGAELEVALAGAPAAPPALLQVAVELPAALSLAPGQPLVAAQPLVTLDGQNRGNRFQVVCGDAQNPAAAPLQLGPLFRLRLQARTPRQPGTYMLLLRDLQAATSDGSAAAVETNPTQVRVVVR